MDGPLHSNAKRYILFLYGRTLHGAVPEILPPKWAAPGKIARGCGRFDPKNEPRPNVLVRRGCPENGSSRQIWMGLRVVRSKERTFIRSCIRGGKRCISTVFGVALVTPKPRTYLEKTFKTHNEMHVRQSVTSGMRCSNFAWSCRGATQNADP